MQNIKVTRSERLGSIRSVKSIAHTAKTLPLIIGIAKEDDTSDRNTTRPSPTPEEIIIQVNAGRESLISLSYIENIFNYGTERDIVDLKYINCILNIEYWKIHTQCTRTSFRRSKNNSVLLKQFNKMTKPLDTIITNKFADITFIIHWGLMRWNTFFLETRSDTSILFGCCFSNAKFMFTR